MQSLRFTLELTTPAFLGGAGNTASASDGLRPPSLKGLLRFWWRSMRARETTVQGLFGAETKRFGGISGGGDGEETAMQGAIIAPDSPHHANCVERMSFQGVQQYLAYGPVTFKEPNQAVIKPGSRFSFRILHRDAAALAEIADALWLLGAFGGCGARSRKGWGGLNLIEFEGIDKPWFKNLPSGATSVEDFLQRLGQAQKILGDVPASAEYTAWTNRSRVLVWNKSFPTWNKALDAVGNELWAYRKRMGKDVQLERQPGYQPGPDYKLMTAFLKSGALNRAPARASFGLPHNYFFRSSKTNVEVKPAGLERRASPVFLRISRFGENEYIPVVTFLPSRHLPEGVRLQVTNRTNRKSVPVSADPDFTGVKQWIDQISGANGPAKKVELWANR